jgi:hypothetical protein
MTPTAPDSLRYDQYFLSYEAFKPLQQKARFALRASRFEDALPDEDRDILNAFVRVSEGDYLRDFRQRISNFDAKALHRVMQRLVEGREAPELQRSASDPPLPARGNKRKRKPHLRIKVSDRSGGAPVSMDAELRPPTPSEQIRRARAIAEEVFRRKRVPIVQFDPLKCVADFETLFQNVKLALHVGIEDGSEKELAKQVIGAKALLDQFEPLDVVVKRCFSDSVLERLIPKFELKDCDEPTDEEKRRSFFNRFLERYSKPLLIEEAESDSGALGERHRRMEESKQAESRSKSDPAVFHRVMTATKPLLHQRSCILTEFEGAEHYPIQLRNYESFRKLVEGAVFMKHRFISAYAKNFSRDIDRQIIDKLIQYYLVNQYLSLPQKETLRLCFQELLEQHRGQVMAVVDKLTRKQTMTKLNKGVKQSTLEPLPSVFCNAVFLDPERTRSFIQQLLEIKYRFSYRYQADFSSEEKRHFEFFFEILVAMDIFSYDFTTAIRYLISDFKGLDAGAIEKILLKVDIPALSSAREQVSPNALAAYLETEPFFYAPEFFEFFVRWIREVLPRLREEATRKLAHQILAAHQLMTNEKIDLKDAIARSLSPAALRHLFGLEDDARSFAMLKKQMGNLKPGMYLTHRSLEREEDLSALLQKASQWVFLEKGSLDVLLVVRKLKEVKKMIEEKKIPWRIALYWQFHSQMLRALFDCTNDKKNSDRVAAAISEIIK